MAMHTTRPLGGLDTIGAHRETVGSALSGIGALLLRIMERIRVERERRAAIAMLRSFNGQQLADIGIARDEIETAVRTGRSRRMMRGL